MWTGATPLNVIIGNEVGWKETPVCVWPSPFTFWPLILPLSETAFTNSMKMSPDCLLDGVFNNSYPDEGTSHYLDACGKYHPLSCHHSDDPDSLITAIPGKVGLWYYSYCHCSHHCRHFWGNTAAVALTQTAIIAETTNAIVSKSAEALQAYEVLNQHLYQAIHIL